MNAILWSWLSAGLGMMTATLLSFAAFAAAPAGDDNCGNWRRKTTTKATSKTPTKGSASWRWTRRTIPAWWART